MECFVWKSRYTIGFSISGSVTRYYISVLHYIYIYSLEEMTVFLRGMSELPHLSYIRFFFFCWCCRYYFCSCCSCLLCVVVVVCCCWFLLLCPVRCVVGVLLFRYESTSTRSSAHTPVFSWVGPPLCFLASLYRCNDVSVHVSGKEIMACSLSFTT